LMVKVPLALPSLLVIFSITSTVSVGPRMLGRLVQTRRLPPSS